MSIRTLFCALAVIACSTASLKSGAGVLCVGDPAPPIKVMKFVKGTPVTGFDKGKVYVVDFWATWCSHCIECMPHVTRLARKYKDVSLIGVSVWERDQKLVEPFVKTMGDKMDCVVAMDDVSSQPGKGAMADSWLKAAYITGIPAAFIINRDGVIAWIG